MGTEKDIFGKAVHYSMGNEEQTPEQMSKDGLEGYIIGTTPTQGKLSGGIDVSSRSGIPYRYFSPFSFSPDFKIPVPGREEIYSNSVESIWQGLKIIDGETNFSLFNKKPKKRKGNVEGHLFGEKIFGIVEAREMIYKPAYLFYLDNCIKGSIKEDILLKSLTEDLAFYDFEDNLDIKDVSSPLAHSAILAEFFKKYRSKRLTHEREKIDRDYHMNELEHETLAEPLNRSITRLKKSSEIENALTIYVLNKEYSELDKFHKRFYSKLLEKITK